MQLGRFPTISLVGVEKEEGNHQGEQASSFREGETQDGVREELTCNGKSR
jgi:hypothetical protein